MPPHEHLFQAAAIALLVISTGLIIAGAVLDYQDGLGAGAEIYQFGKLLLIGSGGLAIWYFKWSRGKAGASVLPKMTFGMYALWFGVAAVIVVGTYLQTQETSFTEDDRLSNLILSILPPVLAASIVVYFLIRDAIRSELNKKDPPRTKAGPRSRRQ